MPETEVVREDAPQHPTPKRGRGRRPKPAAPASQATNGDGRELVLRDGNALAAQALLSETSLNLPDNLTHDEFRHVVKHLSRAHRSILFWVGDLIVAGEKFGEKLGEGSGIIDELGYAHRTLVQAEQVARAFPHSQRNADPKCSWAHHLAVITLDHKDRKYWLSRVVAENLSVRELKTQLERWRGGGGSAAANGKAHAEAEPTRKRKPKLDLAMLLTLEELDKELYDQNQAALTSMKEHGSIEMEPFYAALHGIAIHIADLMEVCQAIDPELAKSVQS